MKALKKKEAEETKALEEMVLKVESNLEATTVRIHVHSVWGGGEGWGLWGGEVKVSRHMLLATACIVSKRV